MPVRSVLRPLRAAMFAAVCVALTATGHVLTAGAPVGPLALAAGFSAIFGAAVFADRREVSQVAITLGMLSGQLGLHLLFSLFGHAAEQRMVATHSDGAMPVAAEQGGWLMPLAHLLAGLLAGWWLRRGEASCWRLVRRVETVAVGVRRLRRLVVALVVGVAPADLPAAARLFAPACRTPRASTLIRHSLLRRGPPRIT